MAKAKNYYTIEEAAEMLHTSATTVRVLLAYLRPDEDVAAVTRIRTSELERIYTMLKKQDQGR